ncbi:GTP cyclohydrolase I [Phialemonium atrogriseum]|uniref:GTP cyclohydrolase 1 n=1 Tax=Phialemonium atrogriseum TaxID=1093897 RepID=A0AAJ0BUF0_9PEZI|nr:GTP cyclohydrolase I [Phialemonium atrogriseum]KAK1762201.1 GTP cyclohydrolase I [Phialemonium atrogriseum]
MVQFENAGSESTSSGASAEGDSKRRRSGPDGKERKKKRKSGGSDKRNGTLPKRRRPSMSKPARDLRDEPPPTPGAATPEEEGGGGKKAGGGGGGKVTRSPSPVVDFDGLSRPSAGTRERLDETPEQAAVRLQRMSGAVRTILECVGEDPDREGLLATPERYAKAMLFFTKGYQQNVRDIVNGAIFHEGHNEMVIVKDIDIFSLCEHHLVPFNGKMHIGYIPANAVIGISKLPRIAEMFSRRLQIQERLTREVANAIMEVLKPQGVAVVMESSHLCMVMRGVEKTSSTTITSCVLGCFERKEKTRNEFLSLVGVNRR